MYIAKTDSLRNLIQNRLAIPSSFPIEDAFEVDVAVVVIDDDADDDLLRFKSTREEDNRRKLPESERAGRKGFRLRSVLNVIGFGLNKRRINERQCGRERKTAVGYIK